MLIGDGESELINLSHMAA